MAGDHYQVLGVSPSASADEIKTAYRRALLIAHPDKQLSAPHPTQLDIIVIQDAYRVLSSPELRAQHDAQRSRHGPRPAQVVSLEEFDYSEITGLWTHSCRCGGKYTISEDQMDKDQHLIGCSSCSETIWAGYELAPDDGE